MQKWEYCVISGVDRDIVGLRGSYPKLQFFSLQGIATTVDLGNHARLGRPKGYQDLSEGEYIAHAIARFGQDGWEMVGAGSASSDGGTGSQCLYFRRPLP